MVSIGVMLSTASFVLILGFFVGCCTASTTLCDEVTDIIILLESKDTKGSYDVHKRTALELVHRLPMSKDNVRVTVAQFNDKKSELGFSFRDTLNSDGATQKKSLVLHKISQMKLLSDDGDPKHGGSLLGAMEFVTNEVLPNVIKKIKNPPIPAFNKKRRHIYEIVLVTIVSGYWKKPNFIKLGKVFVKMSIKGVVSYVVAYSMDDAPSLSILPFLVTKLDFLILPGVNRTYDVAGYLSDSFKVCWKDGPCWPNNPCHYGCECHEDPMISLGYECVSQGPYWLSNNCTKPAALLSCKERGMELRLPKHYVTNSEKLPADLTVFSGMSEEWPKHGKPHNCIAKVVNDSGRDPNMDKRASAILDAEGSYYLISHSYKDNNCLLSFHHNVSSKTLTIEDVVFKTRLPLPNNVIMHIPVVIARCVYPVEYDNLANVEIKNDTDAPLLSDAPAFDPVSRSFMERIQNDEALDATSVLAETILLEGNPFNYNEWRKSNPFRDPDDVTEMIERNGGIVTIMEGVQTGKIPTIGDFEDHGIVENPWENIIPRMDIECHDGPYEAHDPCNPMYRTTPEPTTQTEVLSTTQPIASVDINTIPLTTPVPTEPIPDKETTHYASITAMHSHSALRMQIFEDENLTRLLFESAGVGTKLYVLIGPVDGGNGTTGLCTYVRDCWMVVEDTNPVVASGLGPNPGSNENITILDDGCPLQDNVVGLQIKNNGKSNSALFSLQSVKFKGMDPNTAYFVQCNVTICDCSLGSCARSCSGSHNRARRSVLEGEMLALRVPITFHEIKAP